MPDNDQPETLPEPQLPQSDQNGPAVTRFGIYRLGNARIICDMLMQPNGEQALAYHAAFQKRPNAVGHYVALEDLVHMRAILDAAITEGLALVTQHST